MLPLLCDFPDSIIINDLRDKRSLNHTEFCALVLAKSNELHTLNLARLDRVIVACGNPLDYLVAIFSCWQAGLIAVCVNPALTKFEQDQVTKAVDGKAWLHLQNEPLNRTRVTPSNKPLHYNDPALILMTSGTTGVPKGVTHSIEGLRARLKLNVEHIGQNNLERSLCALPLFFGHGLIGNCLTPLFAGAELTLWPSPSIQEMANFSDVLDQQKPTFLSSVPSFWKIILRLCDPAKHRMNRVQIGSAPLSSALGQDVSNWLGDVEVFNTYGMSELANWISGVKLVEKHAAGLVGKPWGGQFAILDDKTVRKSGRGEVLIKSSCMMQEYWNNQELTQNAFHEGWFRTGDIGELSKAQELTLLGRIKSEINRAGIKVLAEEVDMLLERHDQIKEACSFGIDDPVSGEAVAAAVVLHKGQELTQNQLIQWCRSQARAEAVPSKIYFLAEIPKNARGKVVRSDVKTLSLSGETNDV